MLLWIDGFEGYYTTGTTTIDSLLSRRYTSGVSGGVIKSQDGRWGGQCIRMTGDDNYVFTPILTTDATLIVGVAYKHTYATATKLIMLYDGATRGMSLGIDASGELLVYSDATPVAATSGLGLGLNTWYYLEFKVTCNGTTGSYSARLNGSVQLSATGVDTKLGTHDYHDKVKLGAYSYTGYTYFDDFYICDGSGSLNTDLLGQCRVAVTNPDGENSTNWSTIYPANGAHRTSIDDGTISDDDTTYVEDDTTGHLDLFDYASLSTLGTIYGVSVNTNCRVTDANSIDIKTVFESAGDTVTATDTISSSTYVTISNICETDPNTSNLWLEADLNAAHFGFEVG